MAELDNKKIVGVIVKGHVTKTQEKEITANGVYTPDEGYDAFGKVTVNVSLPAASAYGLPETAPEGTVVTFKMVNGSWIETTKEA